MEEEEKTGSGVTGKGKGREKRAQSMFPLQGTISGLSLTQFDLGRQDKKEKKEKEKWDKKDHILVWMDGYDLFYLKRLHLKEMTQPFSCLCL